MSKLNSLIDTATSAAKNESIIRSDLRIVLEAERAGKKRPSWDTLVAFFKEEYNIDTSVTSLRRKYREISNEQG